MAMPISSFFSVQTVPRSYNYDLCNYDQGLCWATVVLTIYSSRTRLSSGVRLP